MDFFQTVTVFQIMTLPFIIHLDAIFFRRCPERSDFSRGMLPGQLPMDLRAFDSISGTHILSL